MSSLASGPRRLLKGSGVSYSESGPSGKVGVENATVSHRVIFTFLFSFISGLCILLFIPWFEDHQENVRFRYSCNCYPTPTGAFMFCCEPGFCNGPQEESPASGARLGPS